MSLIEPDYACEAHIKVDNEIGGPGVAASFLFVSWLTIILALILATHELKLAIQRFKFWRANRNRARLKATTPANLLAPSRIPHAQNHNTPTPSHLRACTPTSNGDTQHEATHLEPLGPNTADLPPKLHKLIQLLGHICDIQVVTALAIIVAGLAQWNRISYYHEILVTQYFQLTLDSFWATRINYMDFYQIDHVHDNPTIPTHQQTPNPGAPSYTTNEGPRQSPATRARTQTNSSHSYYDNRQPRLQVRRAAVFCACILAIIWQFRLYFRENVGPQHWNEGSEGPCYRYLDRSNPIAVLVVRATGLIIFCFALGVTLLGYPWAERVHAAYKWVRGRAMGWATQRFSKSLRRCDMLRARGGREMSSISSKMESTSEKQPSSHDPATTSTDHPKSETTHRKGILNLLAEWTITITVLTMNSFILFMAFLISQWLAIWTYGDGFYPLLWFCYFCFNVWNTISVISLLILNHPLVDPEELDWGFGQVLPVVLLLAIVFVTVDVFSRQEPRPASRSSSNQSEEERNIGL